LGLGRSGSIRSHRSSGIRRMVVSFAMVALSLLIGYPFLPHFWDRLLVSSELKVQSAVSNRFWLVCENITDKELIGRLTSKATSVIARMLIFLHSIPIPPSRQGLWSTLLLSLSPKISIVSPIFWSPVFIIS
jgi:hypothetical protein